MNPTKPLARSLHVDGKMEENKPKIPVNNQESIVDKPSDEMGKINDIEHDGYQRCNVAYDGSQTSRDVTQRCKLKIQLRDNESLLLKIVRQTHRTIRQN